jgi:hypothetical protein
MQNNSDLVRRIIAGLHKDLVQQINGRGVINWESRDSEDEDGIEFHAETSEGDRGLILYRVSDSEVQLAMERQVGDGVDVDFSSNDFPELREMYDTLLNRNFNIEQMNVHELIDFYFRMGE